MFRRFFLILAMVPLAAFVPAPFSDTNPDDPQQLCAPFADQGCACDDQGNPIPGVTTSSQPTGKQEPGWCNPDRPCKGSFELTIHNDSGGLMIVDDPANPGHRVPVGNGQTFTHTHNVVEQCGHSDLVRIDFAVRNAQGTFTSGSAYFTVGCTDWNLEV